MNISLLYLINQFGLNDTGRSSVPDVSRWEADHLAVVVAESLSEARRASALIDTEWEPLPMASDVASAKTDEVLVHPGSSTNTYHTLQIRKGDAAQGMEAADVVIEGTYELPHQEHAYLQVEAATAWIDEQDRVTVETSGQWVHEDREQIAHALALDEEAVRVRYAAIGGAMGGDDMSCRSLWRLQPTSQCFGINRPFIVVGPEKSQLLT